MNSTLKFDLNAFLNSSAAELEKLSYYEMISRMGVSSFNISGDKPIRMIIEGAKIIKNTRVLIVGCGSGGTAILLAEVSGAEVYGIDIAENSIKQAQIDAAKSSAVSLLHFQCADAHHLPFEDQQFDVIITEFVAFFLQPTAFLEFSRVLHPGGVLALAEIMLEDTVTPWAKNKIEEMEKMYSEMTNLPFHIPTFSYYLSILEKKNFTNFRFGGKFPKMSIKERIDFVGGWSNTWKVVKKMRQLMKESPIIKKKFMTAGNVKRIMIQDPRTAKYVYQGVLIAYKKE